MLSEFIFLFCKVRILFSNVEVPLYINCPEELSSKLGVSYNSEGSEKSKETFVYSHDHLTYKLLFLEVSSVTQETHRPGGVRVNVHTCFLPLDILCTCRLG